MIGSFKFFGVFLLASLLLPPAYKAQAQQLYKPIYDNPKCRETYYSGMVPARFQFVGGLMMWIEVAEWRRLNEPAFRQRVLESAFQENLEHCRAKGKRASIAVVTVKVPPESFARGQIVLSAWTSANDRSWHVTTNRVAEIASDIEAKKGRRQADNERRRRREEAKRRAIAERQRADRAELARRQAMTAELRKMAEVDAKERDKKRPADSYCIFSCDPLERHGRQALQNRLQSFIEMPIIITKFRKTDGLRTRIGSADTYEMHYRAELEFPQGFLPKPKSIWGELQRGADGMLVATQLKELMSFKIKSESKKWWEPHSLSGSGIVYFRKSEKGWRGFDGRVYNR